MYLIALGLGLITGGAWVLFVQGVIDNRLKAALADIVIIAPSLTTYQLWADMDNDWRMLALYGVGSVIATYFLSGRVKCQSSTKS